ncbi:MAG TPA: hypothetical protein VIV65_05905 [Gemmatimonadaceae bacterium]
MPIATVQRFPHSRVLLPRTRLAYVHLRNLLTDAKRDRAARISGYVAIWLPEEMIVLYMQHGELVNATIHDKAGSRAVSIARALERVPAEPEYGEITFAGGDDELLDCMFASQTLGAVNFPASLAVSDPTVLFPYLSANMFDGLIEVLWNDSANYLVFANGEVERSYLAGDAHGHGHHHGTHATGDQVARLFGHARSGELRVRRWGSIPQLGTQAPPALVQAYKDLASNLVGTLVSQGRTSAPAIAEHARQALLEDYPVLDGLALSDRPAKSDMVVDTETLTMGIAAWVREVMWTAVDHDGMPPEQLIKDLTWERRHMFQSAGLYEQIPWKVL